MVQNLPTEEKKAKGAIKASISSSEIHNDVKPGWVVSLRSEKEGETRDPDKASLKEQDFAFSTRKSGSNSLLAIKTKT